MRRYSVLRIGKSTFIAIFWVAILFCVLRGYLFMPRISVKPLAPQESFNHPTHVAKIPGKSPVFVVTEKEGIIKWFNKESLERDGIMADLTSMVYSKGWEDGLLSLVFDPHYLQNRYVYVFYNYKKQYFLRISRFTLNQDYTFDLNSELVILEVEKKDEGHNGGHIAFGKDTYLYISVGDGHIDNERLKSRTSLLGTILRIDVSEATAEKPYAIPVDNPFIRNAKGYPEEVWAFGFKSPWRFSFDPVTDDIVVGDVGLEAFEEINIVKKGKDYGYPFLEGEKCISPNDSTLCDQEKFVAPFISLPHWISRSITAGFIYTGSNIPWLKGKYVYGDYLRGMFVNDYDDLNTTHHFPDAILLGKIPAVAGKNIGKDMQFVSFNTDEQGEIYAVDFKGTINEIVAIDSISTIKGFLYSVGNFH